MRTGTLIWAVWAPLIVGAGCRPSNNGDTGGDHDRRLWKPRVIHTTDLGADPDDQQSMVRMYVTSNWFDVEGLIVSTGTSTSFSRT